MFRFWQQIRNFLVPTAELSLARYFHGSQQAMHIQICVCACTGCLASNTIYLSCRVIVLFLQDVSGPIVRSASSSVGMCPRENRFSYLLMRDEIYAKWQMHTTRHPVHRMTLLVMTIVIHTPETRQKLYRPAHACVGTWHNSVQKVRGGCCAPQSSTMSLLSQSK